LTWTSPDDPPFDELAAYDIFYASFSFSSTELSSVNYLAGPSPKAPGNLENITVSGLQNEVEYFFAVRSHDAAGNVSPLSTFSSALTNAAPSVTVLAPSGGDLLSGNSDIVWNVSDPNAGDVLHDIRIFLSKDGGVTYALLHELADTFKGLRGDLRSAS